MFIAAIPFHSFFQAFLLCLSAGAWPFLRKAVSYFIYESARNYAAECVLSSSWLGLLNAWPMYDSSMRDFKHFQAMPDACPVLDNA